MKRLLFAATIALAPITAFAADLSGSWTVNAAFDSMGIKYALPCTFAVDSGGKLTGKCTSDQGEVDPTGTVSGSAVEFGYDTTYQGSPVHLDYKGTVQADGSLSGTVDTGGPQGTFTATKK